MTATGVVHRARPKKAIPWRFGRLPRIAVAATCASLLVGCSAEPAANSLVPHAIAEASNTAASNGLPDSSPSPSPDTVRCRAKADSLTAEQQAGQLFMIGVSTSGLDDKTRKAIESGSIGAVVLLGNSSEGASRISTITSELGEMQSAGMPLLIAVEQGSLADGQLRSRAQTWGTELADAGIHYDLAPVADVVPKDKQDSNAPIGKRNRNFGNDATAVSRSVVEFT